LRLPAPRSTLVLLVLWAALLVLAWLYVLNVLIGNGWFYGVP
jgi:pheromone shutdown protein TraB